MNIAEISSEDRFAIQDLVLRYCRGVDRLDAGQLLNLFANDARYDAGVFVAFGSDSIVPQLLDALRQFFEKTHHMVSNVLLDGVDSSKPIVRGECYYRAFHRATLTGGMLQCILGSERLRQLSADHIEVVPCDYIVGGRYLDVFVREKSGWYIQDRRIVYDWMQSSTSNEPVAGGIWEKCNTRGRRDRHDPCYR